MIFGFAINNNGRSTFGVTGADSEEEAQQKVAVETGVPGHAVVMMSAEEALSQHDGIAFLAPAEL